MSRFAQENADVCLRLVNECNPNKYSPVAQFRNASRNHVNMDHMMTDSRYNDSQKESVTNLTTTSLNDDMNPEIRKLTVMEEILKYLKIMVNKHDEDDGETEIISEWQQVAQVMDHAISFLVFPIYNSHRNPYLNGSHSNC